MKSCASCGGGNRTAAKFCKFCGTACPASTSASAQVMASLVGLDDVREALEAIRVQSDGRRRSGRDPRRPLAMLIVGDSGTAKSRLGPIITSALHEMQLIERAQPVTVNGLQQEDLDTQRLAAAFDKAKGSVLFIDNAQLLFAATGEPYAPFNHLMHLMEESPVDPVVILAGLPSGLEEFCQRTASRNLLGRFSSVFRLSDHLPAQLTEICAAMLRGNGFTLSDATREQLLMRMRLLYRNAKSGDPSIRAINGHLAAKEAHDIEQNYFRRQVNDNVLQPEDVPGPADRVKPIEEIMAELDGFIGMASIKAEIRSLHQDVETARLRQSMGLGDADGGKFAFHFILTGNPGTGKTTVARALGEVFEALGVLPTGHVVEVDRSKLVGEYQGHTATKVVAACKQAEGGVLFIDEAYALCKGSGDAFGQEAIDTLLKRMEDDRGKYVVIAAGYDREMQDFLRTNSGLRSRFTAIYHLDDYTPDELTAIFGVLADKHQLVLGAGTTDKLKAFFEARCARKTSDFANGREARNLLEQVRREQAARLRQQGGALTALQLSTLLPDDVPGVSTGSPQMLEQAMTELEALVGLQGVKDSVRRLDATLKRERVLGRNKPLGRHFIFTGNPGTGKTTVARLMARIFHGLGLLPTDRVVEVTRNELVGQFQGQTAPKVMAACTQAEGGVLFVDEAYALVRNAQDAFGQEAVDTLLKRMEDDRGKFVVIAAGYDREMQLFLDSNSGLRSRFSDRIDFTDYAAPEMQTIFERLCEQEGLQRAPGFDAALAEHLAQLHAHRDDSFANGRTVRQLFDRVCAACGERVGALRLPDSELATAMRLLTPADIPQFSPPGGTA